MDSYQKVLFVDVTTGFYRIDRFPVGRPFFGPIDLGLHLSGRYNSLNIGAGLLAGSIIPGSNRLIVTGFSPCWGGFYISTMGGAALVFDNLGLNMLSIVGKAPTPSILYLNRTGGEEVEVRLLPVELHRVWTDGRGGVYSLMDHVLDRFGEHYSRDPRILAVGPAAEATDFGAIVSVPISKGRLTHVDTWAGRGGFGSKLLRDHNVAAIIYGGTFVDEDFRDRKVADQWFMDKYQKKLAAKDLEATTKYRFDPQFQTGGTFGVNYTTLAGRLLSFNYRSIYATEEERLEIHDKFIVNHYLKQFNDETIKPKKQHTCGEPCAAVCKKMHGEYKKDYEPYQTMGPLSGVFDQRAAEKLTHHADMYGFDAISVGGIVSWLMECMSERSLTPEELGVTQHPVFSPEGFNVVSDSMHNADIGMALLDSIIQGRGILNLEQGARKFARQLSRDKGKGVLDSFVYIAFAQGVDGAQPVLDTGRAVAYGYHGKILYVLWQRLPAAARTGSQKCRATAERVDIGQHGHVSLSQGVGRRDDPGDCRIPVWPEAGFPRKYLHYGGSYQQQKCFGLLGIGPGHRLCLHFSETQADGGGPGGSRAGKVDRPFRGGQTRGRSQFLVRYAQGHP